MSLNPSAAAVSIRPATEGDVPLILTLVRELAEYERLPHSVTATEACLHASLFSPHPAAEVLIAERATGPVGFAVFFTNYSTFLGRSGIYLEDLYVRPEVRGQGIGKQLLSHVAKVAQQRGCQRLEWSVLDWNEPSIEFYRSLGAKPLDDWTTFRMQPEAIAKLAAT